MTYANVASAYRQNAILTASPEKLVKLLYEGAIRHMERSRLARSMSNSEWDSFSCSAIVFSDLRAWAMRTDSCLATAS